MQMNNIGDNLKGGKGITCDIHIRTIKQETQQSADIDYNRAGFTERMRTVFKNSLA